MPQTALLNIGLNYDWDAGSDGWKAGVDNNWVLLDALCQGNVITVQNAQPGTPAAGDRYIIGTSPTGAAWSGNANAVAVYYAAVGWVIQSPVEGWVLYDRTADLFRFWTGTAWRVLNSGFPKTQALVAGNVTIAGDDNGGTIELDTSAAARDVTIPQDSGDDLPIGFSVTLVNASGTNNVTFTTTGLTTRGIAALTTDRQALRIVKVGANTWING